MTTALLKPSPEEFCFKKIVFF